MTITESSADQEVEGDARVLFEEARRRRRFAGHIVAIADQREA